MAVEQLLWDTLVVHSANVTNPAQLIQNKHQLYSLCIDSEVYLCWARCPPLSAQGSPKTLQVKAVRVPYIAFMQSPGLTTVYENR